MSENAIEQIDRDRFPKLTRWLRDKSNSSNLDSFLSSPTGELLIDVLREFAIPEQSPENIGKTHTPEIQAKLAFIQCIQSGQHLSIENLLALRHALVIPEQNSQGEWTGKARIDEQVERQKEI